MNASGNESRFFKTGRLGRGVHYCGRWWSWLQLLRNEHLPFSPPSIEMDEITVMPSLYLPFFHQLLLFPVAIRIKVRLVWKETDRYRISICNRNCREYFSFFFFFFFFFVWYRGKVIFATERRRNGVFKYQCREREWGKKPVGNGSSDPDPRSGN